MQRIFLIILLIISSIALCSCQHTPIEEFYSFLDSNSNIVSLPKKPTNVAILFSSFGEIWSLSGGKINITVQETVDRKITNNNVLLVDNGAGKTINNELLISYKPDFVICSQDINAQVETYNILRNTNIPCALFKIETFNDYLNVLKIMCDINENYDAYIQYGLNIQKKLMHY